MFHKIDNKLIKTISKIVAIDFENKLVDEKLYEDIIIYINNNYMIYIIFSILYLYWI